MADETVIVEVTYDEGSGDEKVYISNRHVSIDRNVLVRQIGLPEYTISIGLWIWETKTSVSFGELTLINNDGALDFLLESDVRDKSVIFKVFDRSYEYEDYEIIANLNIDFLETDDKGNIRVVFINTRAELEKVFQSVYYDDLTPVPELEGQSVPIALGEVYQVPGILHDEINLNYDLSQIPIAEIYDVSSNGHPFLTTQWRHDEYGIKALVTPAGKVTSSFKSNQKTIAQGLTTSDLASGYPSSGHLNSSMNSDFTAWTSTKPTGYSLGFDKVASPEKELERYGLQNRLRIINRDKTFAGLTAQAPRISRDIGLVKGRYYGIHFDFVSVSGWTNRVNFITLGSASLANLNNQTFEGSEPNVDIIVVQDVLGDTTLYFRSSGPVLKVIFGGGLLTEIDTEMVMDSMRVWDVATGEVMLEGLTEFVLDDKWSGTYDSAQLSDLQTDIGDHVLGLWHKDRVKTADLLDDLFKPFLGWWIPDVNREMKFGRLVDPDSIAEASVLNVDKFRIQKGTQIKIYDDLMPGLTNIFGGKKNHYQISVENAAGSVADLGKAEKVSSEFTIVRRGAEGELHEFYRWAEDKCILESNLQDEESIERERDRVASIASVKRKFIEIPIILPKGKKVFPGDKITVTYPRYGLDEGVDFVVISVSRAIVGLNATIIGWR